MMECTAHPGTAGVTLGNEVLTDLDFADDVALLAEMLQVLVLAMTIMQEEAKLFENQNTPGSPILCRIELCQSDACLANSPGGRWTC